MTKDKLLSILKEALTKTDGISDVEILEDGVTLAVACTSGEESTLSRLRSHETIIS